MLVQYENSRLSVNVTSLPLALHMQYFILISLLCLIFEYANTLLWFKRVNRHTDTSYEDLDYEYCGKVYLE